MIIIATIQKSWKSGTNLLRSRGGLFTVQYDLFEYSMMHKSEWIINRTTFLTYIERSFHLPVNLLLFGMA
jgi:hypothetical protein